MAPCSACNPLRGGDHGLRGRGAVMRPDHPVNGGGAHPACGRRCDGTTRSRCETYMLEHICLTGYIDGVLIDWTRSFDDWLDQVIRRADRGDRHAQVVLDLVTSELDVLQDLQSMPEVETPTLRRVRQSRKNKVWRVGHPYVAGAAVRLIIWFPPDRPGQRSAGSRSVTTCCSPL